MSNWEWPQDHYQIFDDEIVDFFFTYLSLEGDVTLEALETRKISTEPFL